MYPIIIKGLIPGDRTAVLMKTEDKYSMIWHEVSNSDRIVALVPAATMYYVRVRNKNIKSFETRVNLEKQDYGTVHTIRVSDTIVQIP